MIYRQNFALFLALVCSAVAFAGAPEESRIIKVDGQSAGRTFDGVGAVSAGGSSRLLIDYPEPERSQILDYLFKPNYGAALQILKVEIGGDCDSTAGAEPSHMRSPGEVNCNRGYEWWLMKEAKARNPKIKLCALAWGAPGWIQPGFWSDDNITYTLAWLDCAKRNGFHIDYLGGGNERGWDADYYVKLSAALKASGYPDLKVVASDNHHPRDYWGVATEMKTNNAFRNAVDVLGEHDVCVWRTLQKRCHVSDDALSLEKPLWDSENSTQDYEVGHEPLARVMNRHYIDARITGNLNWALAGGYYGSFPAPGTGLILADRPWSGYYDLSKIVWVDAHTTQFTAPGWQYLDTACGYTPKGASYVALRDPEADDFSLVIETMDLTDTELLDIAVTGGLSSKPVHLWSTNLRSENNSDHFLHEGKLKPKAGLIQIRARPGFIYTLSTTTGQKKGQARPRASRDQRLPLPFVEDFEKIALGGLAPYFADVHGAFETSVCGGGRSGHSYRQVVEQEPIVWHKHQMPPTTVMGDPSWWGDYELSVDVLMEEPGYVELLGRIEKQRHEIDGYHFRVSDTGAWSLYTINGTNSTQTLAEGSGSPLGTNQWHRFALRFEDSRVSVLRNGRELAGVVDDSHTSGQVGLRVSSWQHAQFDNLQVVATRPWPEFIPQGKIKATASSEHSENDFGSVHLARNAVDDRVETSWRAEYKPRAAPPQSITLDLGGVRAVQGLTYKPPLAPAHGAITEYTIFTSRNGRDFQQVASGSWKPGMATKIAAWPKQRVRFVRLQATETTGTGAAASEIKILR